MKNLKVRWKNMVSAMIARMTDTKVINSFQTVAAVLLLAGILGESFGVPSYYTIPMVIPGVIIMAFNMYRN